MKKGLLIIGVSFAVTLAIVIGTRISADALAVIVGVLLGVAGSIPTAVVIAYVFTRARSTPEPHLPPPYQPPVVVINGSERANLSPQPPLTLPTLSPPGQGRKWTVIGADDTETGGDY